LEAKILHFNWMVGNMLYSDILRRDSEKREGPHFSCIGITYVLPDVPKLC